MPRAGSTPRPSLIEESFLRVARTSNLPLDGLMPRAPSFGILSTFPPTACGLATFSAALAAGLAAHGAEVSIVRVGDHVSTSTGPVIGELVNGSPVSVAGCSDLLNRSDVALVQHEYGLFGGEDGDEVLEIIAGLRVPSIVIAHTVLTNPSPHQRSVLVEVADMADRVVVMSDAARDRLCARFEVDPRKVVTIPHGAVVPKRMIPARHVARPTLLTWGLIGPGKGIERVVGAMASLRDLPVRPHYLVAGQTHPKVRALHGEAYRQARMAQASHLGISDSVTFDARYRDVASLTALIQASAVVVLPYDSKEQATSGVLVDAIAAGKPVVATAFPHAVELLSGGAGILVDHDDPDAMSIALRRVLIEPGLAPRMAAEASRLAPTLGWPVISRAYQRLATHLLTERPVLV
jgi:glycosyltransferase involved in cell wall biosynthesis